MTFYWNKTIWGSGCGLVGRAVASDARGPRFESSHRRNLMMNMFSVNCWKVENKDKKRPGMAQLIKLFDVFLWRHFIKLKFI